jgi:urease accessory protein UreF
MTSGEDPGLKGAALGLARLLQFGDSMFPIGGFSFSGGLESAIQQRVVTDAASLLAFARTATAQAASGDGIALIHATAPRAPATSWRSRGSTSACSRASSRAKAERCRRVWAARRPSSERR